MWTYKASSEQANTFTAKKSTAHPAGQTPVQPFAAQKKPAAASPPQQSRQPAPKTASAFTAAGWQDETDRLLYAAPPAQAAPMSQTPQTPAQPQTSQVLGRAARAEYPPTPAKTAFYGKKNARLLGLAYLAGLPAGSLAFQFLGTDAGAYMGYYLDARLQTMAGPPLRILSGQFLAAFLQLTLVLLCGFCAFGAALLVLQAALRGAVFGCFCSGLLARYAMQGALAEGLLFWLPEVLQAALQILLGACALQMSLRLAALCFGGRPRPGQPAGEPARRLLSCYLVCCLAALVPCGLSALSGLLFGPVLSGVLGV